MGSTSSQLSQQKAKQDNSIKNSTETFEDASVDYNTALFQKANEILPYNPRALELNHLKQASQLPQTKIKNYDDLLRGPTIGQLNAYRMVLQDDPSITNMPFLSRDTSKIIANIEGNFGQS